MPAPPVPASNRSTVRRKADRGRYHVDTIHAILDEALICHVGFAVDGRPWVVPTAFARVDDHLYLHGAVGNFALRALAGGTEACITVTLLDGLVLARSAFHHSMNYRSVMAFGKAEAVTAAAEKEAAVLAITDHLVPGRLADTRLPTAGELRATLVVRFPLDEASAKVRTGPPIDDPGDLALPHWAGVIPLCVVRGEPVPDAPRPSRSAGRSAGGGHHELEGRPAAPLTAVPVTVKRWSAGPARMPAAEELATLPCSSIESEIGRPPTPSTTTASSLLDRKPRP